YVDILFFKRYSVKKLPCLLSFLVLQVLPTLKSKKPTLVRGVREGGSGQGGQDDLGKKSVTRPTRYTPHPILLYSIWVISPWLYNKMLKLKEI
ncbi:MAG: hypothetical protein SAK29_34225, partial [Scytonema sp. PMC 1069.18]|nr:hypothetical protein [Scytonema sp. PMC 1069.18]